jgi:hypothetical protein
MAPFLSRFASALVVVAAIATPRVQAWGPIGHEVAASLAMKYLSSAAVSQLQDILSEEPGAGDLVQVWPFSLPVSLHSQSASPLRADISSLATVTFLLRVI